MSFNSPVAIGRFTDLSEMMLTVPGKIQVCEHFVGIPPDDKLSIRDFAQNHKLSKSTFHETLKKYLKLESTNVNEFHGKTGRPPLLDSPAKKDII